MSRAADRRQSCRRCGGSLRFDVLAGAAVCLHCGARDERDAPPQRSCHRVRQFRPREPVPVDQPADAFSPPAELPPALTCSGCGAITTIRPDEITAECPFCQSALVRRELPASTDIMPGEIAPFAVNEQAAKHALIAFLSATGMPRGRARRPVGDAGMTGRDLPAFVLDIRFAAEVNRFKKVTAFF